MRTKALSTLNALAPIFLAMLPAARSEAPLKTIEDRVAEFGNSVRARLAPQFESVGVPYPPTAVTLIGIKSQRTLEVHAAGADGVFRFICRYPVLAASGLSGPKLREGDRQVPEGIYAVESLNPNSDFHLALRLNYPNEFDCARGAEGGQEKLGGDIMIHGDEVSRGCLAMGDQAAEDLFVLAALTGIENLQVILAPEDMRVADAGIPAGAPHWTAELYAQIKRELAGYSTPRL